MSGPERVDGRWVDEAGDRISDAGLCRRMGWVVGTVLEGDEPGCCGLDRIVLTAVGEQCVLARRLAFRGKKPDAESLWTLDARHWREVKP